MLLANKQIGGQQNGVPIDGLKATADYFRERLREIKLEKLAIGQRTEAIQDTINKLARQLQQLNATGSPKSVSEVLVEVDAPQAARTRFNLSYLVSQAGWSPLYSLRVEEVGKPVGLEYKAQVYQQSGEDWDKVSLTLSTGRPMSQSAQPVLNPWWLYTHPPIAQNRREKEYYLDGVAIEEELQEVPAMAQRAPAAPPPVSVSDQATTFQFEIKIPYDIPTDGQQYVVGIGEHELPATYEYYAVPKLTPHAFLTAKVMEWEQYRLLSGPANLFFEGTYLGKSHLNVSMATDTLSFSLGIDEGIVIKRNKDKQYTDKQFIGNKKTQTIGWEIELRNSKRVPVEIIVEDQYPIATSDEMEVELGPHRGAEADEATGKLRWELELPAGKTRRLAFRYSVKYPKKMHLPLE